MAWPNNRIVTLNPSDPVPSALLDALQDAIIGGGHGLVTLAIPGLQFVSSKAGGSSPVEYSQVTIGGAEVSTIPGTSNELRAGVVIPTNAIAVNARFFVKDHATGPNKCRCRVYKSTIYGGALSEPVAAVDSSGAGANQTIALNGLNIGGGTGININLCVQQIITGAAQRIIVYGAEVDFYVPT